MSKRESKPVESGLYRYLAEEGVPLANQERQMTEEMNRIIKLLPNVSASNPNSEHVSLTSEPVHILLVQVVKASLRSTSNKILSG